MGTITPYLLSGSTNGRAIKIAATATPGTLLHTAIAGTETIDAIWLATTNTDTVSRVLVLEFGGVTSPDDLMYFTVPPRDGWLWIAKGLYLQNGLVVRAFCATANVLTVVGQVHRIIP